MTDVSDGLVADLGHIARASGVGIDLSRAALGADHDAVAAAAAALATDPWAWVLGGRRGPRAGRDVPGSAAGRLAGDRAGGRRAARVLVDGERVARKPGLAVVLTDARTLG